MSKLVLALAGVWHVHIGMFLETINKQYGDQIEWRYVWDDHKDTAEKISQMLGAKAIDSLDEALNDPDVKAIVCEARTYLHKDIIIRSINAKKHVYTDKSCTINAEDVLKIKDALDKTPVKFTISHESIPTAPHQYAKKIIDEGKLGKIVSIHFRRCHWFAKPVEEQNEFKVVLPEDWFTPEISGGGVLNDLAIHGISLMEYFVGKPRKIIAFTENYTGHRGEDSATVMMKYDCGTIGTVHADMVTNTMDNNLEIIGTDGILTIIGMDGNERILLNSSKMEGYEHGMSPVDISVINKEAKKLPLCQFIDLVMDDTDDAMSPNGLGVQEAVNVVTMVSAAYKSVEEGRIVEFE